MGEVIVTLTVFPDPEKDVEKVKEEIKKKIEENGGKDIKIEEEPIAFGLNKLVFRFLYPEAEFPEEKMIEEIKKIEGVSEAEVSEVTRCFV